MNSRPDTDLTDSELESVRLKAVGGDSKAIARIFGCFYPGIYRYIFYRVNSDDDARDLTSEVFLKLAKSIGGQKGSLYAWVYRIASNCITDLYRRRAVRREVPYDDDSFNGAVMSPDRALERKLTGGAVRRAMSRLSEDEKNVLILRFIEGRRSKDIAGLLGKSPEAVRIIQFRALAGLRKILDGKGA